jgi:hypothetical protein
VVAQCKLLVTLAQDGIVDKIHGEARLKPSLVQANLRFDGRSETTSNNLIRRLITYLLSSLMLTTEQQCQL